MTGNAGMQPAGWYYAEGDPPGTQRYWDGTQWQGGPQPVGQPFTAAAGSGLNLAEPGSRLGARLIDTVAYIIINLIISIPFGVGAALAGTGDGIGFGVGVLLGLIGLAVLFVNEVVLTARSGGTVGKKALGMKVVNTDGSAVDQSVAIRRASPYLALSVLGLVPVLGILGGLITFVLAIVGLVMLFSDDERRLPWDRIADTRVVKA